MSNILKYDDFISVNEGKLTNVQSFGNYVLYNGENFPGINIPKRYFGKGKYKYRVLAREADKVKPINFGDKKAKVKPLNRLNKKYWESIPYYK